MSIRPYPESLASAPRRKSCRKTVVLYRTSSINRYDTRCPGVSRVACHQEAGIPLIINIRSYGTLLGPSYLVTSKPCRIRNDVYQRIVMSNIRLSGGVYRCSRQLREGGYPVFRAYAEGQGKHGIQAWYTTMVYT